MTHRECTTHHHACDCREAAFSEMRRERDGAREALERERTEHAQQVQEMRARILRLEVQNGIAKEALKYLQTQNCLETDCQYKSGLAREALERMGEK